jgi:hypothetical protein
VRTVSITSPKPLGEALAEFAAGDLAARVVRVWANGNLGELVYLGNEETTIARLRVWLAERFGEEGLVIEPVLAPEFLAEPEVTFRLHEGARCQFYLRCDHGRPRGLAAQTGLRVGAVRRNTR